MSKMDALRAMREERYEQAAKRGGQPSARRYARPVPSPSAVPGPPPMSKQIEAPTTDAPDEESCGHKNMGGRTCTRPRGHAEKSHRYG